jgi:hypothetical protein
MNKYTVVVPIHGHARGNLKYEVFAEHLHVRENGSLFFLLNGVPPKENIPVAFYPASAIIERIDHDVEPPPA